MKRRGHGEAIAEIQDGENGEATVETPGSVGEQTLAKRARDTILGQSPAFLVVRKKWGWILSFVLRKLPKSILAINPSGIRDMETGVPPLKPAGPGVFFLYY